LSNEMWACGLQAYAMATGTTKAATIIVAKVARRLCTPLVRPDFGNTATPFWKIRPSPPIDDDSNIAQHVPNI